MKRALQIAIPLAGLLGLGTTAIAEVAGNDGYVEARLVSKDIENRSITVRLEDDNTFRTFRITDDAELIKTFDNNLRRSIRIEDMNIGNEVFLQLETVSQD